MKVMKFPYDQFSIWNIVTKNCFTNIMKLLYGKIHFLYSHVADEILGHLHGFSNQKVRENKDFFIFCA